MRRTTIFIPEPLHERLRKEAFAARVSMAQLIRSRLAANGAKVRPKKDPLRKVEGIIRDGHLAEGIDEALYGN